MYNFNDPNIGIFSEYTHNLPETHKVSFLSKNTSKENLKYRPNVSFI